MVPPHYAVAPTPSVLVFEDKLYIQVKSQIFWLPDILVVPDKLTEPGSPSIRKEDSTMVSDPPAVKDQQVDEFRRDGVLLLRGIFADWVKDLQRGMETNIGNPSWRERSIRPEDGSSPFFQDYCNWDKIPEYRRFVTESCAAAVAGRLMGSKTARLFHEHVLIKEPGSSVVTPWHHDMPYYCVEGSMTCSLWITLDPVMRDCAIEYIAGSHAWNREFRPERFNGTALTPGDTREPMPDIAANRAGYDIRGWAMAPGDAVAFTYWTVHGAPANRSANRRRAFSIRFVGDDVVYAEKGVHSPPFPEIGLKIGDPLSGDQFPVLWRA
ncbi:MAG: phytanoyl-CoA dioxygenase family protein [Rhodospirillaceae bacterium]|nr:phytanoyl-CoA dioxygenase family protein [Rhodospirillaceae bacterium]